MRTTGLIGFRSSGSVSHGFNWRQVARLLGSAPIYEGSALARRGGGRLHDVRDGERDRPCRLGCRSRRVRRDTCQDFLHLVEVSGLDQMVIEPRLLRPLPV